MLNCWTEDAPPPPALPLSPSQESSLSDKSHHHVFLQSVEKGLEKSCRFVTNTHVWSLEIAKKCCELNLLIQVQYLQNVQSSKCSLLLPTSGCDVSNFRLSHTGNQCPHRHLSLFSKGDKLDTLSPGGVL